MRYINPESAKKAFTELKASPYFVDKSGFVPKILPSIGIAEKYVCITRPRRFGKTSNAQMLAAFLSRGIDAAELFECLIISRDTTAKRHLGSHDVIYIDFSVLPDDCKGYDDYIEFIRSGIVSDLRMLLPEAEIAEGEGLFAALSKTLES